MHATDEPIGTHRPPSARPTPSPKQHEVVFPQLLDTVALLRPAFALTPVRTACRTLIGYFVATTFGTVEFGCIFWLPKKIKSFFDLGLEIVFWGC